jgi:hypothetical protein
LPVLILSARWGLLVNSTLWSLYVREISRVPVVDGAGWASGLYVYGEEKISPTGVRNLDLPARSP